MNSLQELWTSLSPLLPGKDLLWAAVGALIGFGLNTGYERFRVLRTETELFRSWYSTWQPAIVPGTDWTTEEVTITRRFGRIHLRSKGNSHNMNWEGQARLIQETFLIGEWQSTKPGANMRGVFCFTFAVHGNALLGFFLAPDRETDKIASPGVLGRTKADMALGRQKIERLLWTLENTTAQQGSKAHVTTQDDA